MKLLWSTALALGLFGLLAGDSLAQNQNQPGTQTGGQKGKKQFEEQQKADVQQFLNRFDRNEDNAVQKDELPARLQDGFSKIDQNNDGKLDRQELREHALRLNVMCDQCQGGYILMYRAVYDPITRKDLQQVYQTLRKVDENSDGDISEKEIKDAQKEIREQHARSVFQEWDRNNDSKLERNEVGRFLGDSFEELDRDRNGAIDMDEMQSAFEPRNLKGNEARGN